MKTNTEKVSSLFENAEPLNHIQLLEGMNKLGVKGSQKWYLSRGIIKIVGSVVNPIDRKTSPSTMPLYNINL